MEKLKARLQEFFFTPSMGYPLAALRMAIGYMVILESVMVFRNIDDLYGQYGYLQANLMDAIAGPNLPAVMGHLGMGADTYAIFLRGLYGAYVLLGILFFLGFRTRPTSILLWIAQTMIVNSGYVSIYGVHRYLHNLVFLSMWMPMAQVWSIDQWRSRVQPVATAACTTSLRLVQIFLLMTYVNAGYAKGMGTDWWSGEAIWVSLNLPEFHQFNFFWMANFPWLAKLASRGTLFLETFYIIGYWVPYVGTAWALSVIGMHLGIAIFMGLTLFGTSLALVNAVVFLIPWNYKPQEHASRRFVVPMLRTS